MNDLNSNKIIVDNVSKVYKIYNKPTDRFKEALSAKNKKLHSDFYALKNITVKISGGKVFGIVGRNGAGKSTLLKIITGVLTPTEGTVNINGRISSLLELGTGFNMEYTGIENIYFYGTIMGLTKKQIDDKFDSIISFAEIGDYIYQPVKIYSSGMFARLAFSCAINVNPDILIIDEILSVGDMRFQAKCYNKFKEFTQNGVTIIYVGHDVGMMRTFCDEVMWLNNGSIVDIGDPQFICAKYTEFMYLEDTISFTEYKKVEYVDKITNSDQENRTISNGNKIDDIKNKEIKSCDSIFKDSIAHWGTNIGIIENVKLLNIEEKEVGYFSPYEEIKILIELNLSCKFDYEFFSVAFSIKNKEGTDLLVKTTYDEGKFFNKYSGKCTVEFSFISHLASGEYYLVVAIENRKNASITYYEYIEGVKYFKIYSDKRIFGIIDPDVKLSIIGDCDENKR